MLKKNHSLWIQLKHIFSRHLLFLIILNYWITVGILNAAGSLAGEIYKRFDLSPVIFYTEIEWNLLFRPLMDWRTL
jgi:hypothetical protein